MIFGGYTKIRIARFLWLFRKMLALDVWLGSEWVSVNWTLNYVINCTNGKVQH